MTCHFSKIVNLPFDVAIAATTDSLKKYGFGVLTQIDVRDTLHKKSASTSGHTILGACNPKLAYEALTLEDKIGTMLPCNVIVQREHRFAQYLDRYPKRRAPIGLREFVVPLGLQPCRASASPRPRNGRWDFESCGTRPHDWV